MANEDIRSNIAAINNKINRLRNEANELQGQLNMIANACANSTSVLNATSNRMNVSLTENNNILHYANNMMEKTMATQLQIKELFYIFKDVETANKRIRFLNNRLYFEFKNQNKVRKIVRGFLDNIDLEIVSNERIYKSIEKQHLQTPDYWLTFVLLGIMYWKEDNKEKCNQCIESALELNESATIMFMMLFNLKLGRLDAVTSWFKCYQGLAKTGKDDSTYLMLISTIPVKINEFDSDRVNKLAVEVFDFIKREIENSRNEEDDQNYIQLIEKFYKSLDVEETLHLENIRKYVTDYQNMAKSLSFAKNNEEILAFLEETGHVLKKERNVLVDKYFEELLSLPCSGEVEIRKEIELNEEIIRTVELVKSSGDLVTSSNFKKIALERVQAKEEHDSSELNLNSEIVKWFFVKKNKDANSLTNWNLFVLNKDYAEKAYINYQRDYKKLNGTSHNIEINDLSLKSSINDISRDIKAKNEFIESKKNKLLSGVKNTLVFLFAAIAILTIVGGIYFATQENSGLSSFMFVLTAICAIIAVFKLLSNISAKKKIIKRMEEESVKLERIIEDIYDEKKEFDQRFAEADDVSKDIYEFFVKL